MLEIFGLVFFNFIWSAGFAISKTLLESGYKPYEISFFRYLFALVSCVVLLNKKILNQNILNFSKNKFSRYDIVSIFAGFFSFFISPLIQLFSLKYTYSSHTTFMIAIEPMVLILVMSIVFKDKIQKKQVLALSIAVIGVFVLSGFGSISYDVTAKSLLPNLIFLVSTLTESMYSVCARIALKKNHPIRIFVLSLIAGFCLMFFLNLIIDYSRFFKILNNFAFNIKDWFKFFLLGTLGTTFGYIFWIQLMTKISIQRMAITLYLQPILGVFWGYVLLNEAFYFSTFLGGMLILFSLYLSNKGS
jgi:drug/metabolite transporter (DMT)-like permease